MQAIQLDISWRNRGSAALRWVYRDGRIGHGAEPTARTGEIDAYWTQCACGWCGLRVDDPEVARREYDVHTCAAADGVGQDAVSRAQDSVDRTTIQKHTTRVAPVGIPSAPGARAMTDEFVDVPVTRRARVTKVGVLGGHPGTWHLIHDPGREVPDYIGAQIVVRPRGGEFRRGVGMAGVFYVDVDGIPAACAGDEVYRVEDAP